MISKPRIGAVIDRTYTLHRELPSSQSALLFEAHHVDTGRVCVVEVTGSARARARGSRRMLREAQLLTVARGAPVRQLLEVGICATHGPYLVLEPLRGRTLDGLLAARGRLPVHEVVQLTYALCEAVSELHAAGLVHRDVRPANVLLSPTKTFDRIVLLDLELAAPIVPTDRSGQFVRRSVVELSDPLDPEAGSREMPYDERVDVLGIAATVFEALTGWAPFSDGPAVERRDERALRARDLCPDVPAGLSDALDEALDLSPSERPATLRELAWSIARGAGIRQGKLRLLSPLGAPATRRGHTRTDYTTPARLRCDSGYVDGRSEDISEKGMLFVSREAPPQESEMLVSFAMPSSGDFIEARAAVRWCRSHEGRYAVGLEFLDLAPLHSSELALHSLLRGHELPSLEDYSRERRSRREAVAIPDELLALIA